MALFISIVFSFIPAFFYVSIVYFLDRYEKEPKLVVGAVFVWGAIVAAGAAYVLNTILGVGFYLVTESESFSNIATATFVAPPVEESFKGLAILLVFLLMRKEFDNVMDGIVYASAVALGFAATENVLYLYQFGFLEDGWGGLWFLFFLRVILGAWNHAMFTAFTGIGLAFARLTKFGLGKLVFPIIGWGLAVFAHFLHNAIASFVVGLGGLAFLFFIDWFGWLFIFIVMMVAVQREKRWLQTELIEEVESRVISEAQYKMATSSRRRFSAALSTFGSQKFWQIRKFNQLATELAYKKHQSQAGSPTSKELQMIEDLRFKVRQLSQEF